jgi:hypothetical protein
MGKRVLGKIDARNRTAPNSKTREFHVKRKWEMKSRLLIAGDIPRGAVLALSEAEEISFCAGWFENGVVGDGGGVLIPPRSGVSAEGELIEETR